jgi:Ca2+-binding EF-hand superfamily protein
LEKIVATLFAMSVIGTTGSAFAEAPRGIQPPNSLRSMYRNLVRAADRDGDARVSRGELEQLVERHVLARAATRFQRLDRNADGRVSRAEVPRMAAERFARFDANHDGAFTAQELSGTVRSQAVRSCDRLIGQIDTDRDGEFSVADLGTDAGPTVVVVLEPALVAAADVK